MGNLREFELKFRWPSDPVQGARLAQTLELAPASGKQVYSAYFDTADRQLAQARGALRVRKVGDGWVQTIKGEGLNPFERFEHETAISTPTPCREQLPPASTANIAARVRQVLEQLQPVFETDFTRIKRRTSHPPSRAGLSIEYAWDQGEVRASGLSAGLNELELELLHGSERQFLRRARKLVTQFDLTLRQTSKAQLAARLAGEELLNSTATSGRPAQRRLGSGSVRVPLLKAAGDLAQVLLLFEIEQDGSSESVPGVRTASAGMHQLALLLRQMLLTQTWPTRLRRDIQLLAAKLAHRRGHVTAPILRGLSLLIIDLAWHHAVKEAARARQRDVSHKS